MIRSAKALAGAAALALIGGSMAAAATSRASGEGAGMGASSGQCEVQVNRAGSAGSYDVTRQVKQGGECVCFVRTGPESQGGNAEALLAALRESKDCADAPAAVVAAGIPTALLVGGSVVAVGTGLVVASSKSNHDSP